MPAVVISPEHTQKKKYEVKCPLLSYRGDSSCLPLKMVFPASGARRQTLGELTVFPPALEQYAGGAWHDSATRMKTKGTRKGRCSGWCMEPEKEGDKLLTDLLKMPERQQQKDRDLFDNVYPGEEKISCTLKRSVPSPVFSFSFFLLFRTLRWCSLIPICN